MVDFFYSQEKQIIYIYSDRLNLHLFRASNTTFGNPDQKSTSCIKLLCKFFMNTRPHAFCSCIFTVVIGSMQECHNLHRTLQILLTNTILLKFQDHKSMKKQTEHCFSSTTNCESTMCNYNDHRRNISAESDHMKLCWQEPFYSLLILSC